MLKLLRIIALTASCCLAFSHHAYAQSPTDLPLFTLNDLQFEGGFAVDGGDYGVSTMNYTDGQLAYNPARHSMFLIGHDHQDGAIAEFKIPPLVKSTDIHQLNSTGAPLQVFARSPLYRVSNPQNINRISGLHLFQTSSGPQLMINGIDWYDAAGDNTHTTLILRNPNDLSGSRIDGFYRLSGGAGHTAGWISPIPLEWQNILGGTYVTASGGNMSISGRTTMGPAMFVFNPERDMFASGVSNPIPTTRLLDYSIYDEWLNPDYYNDSGTNDVWTAISGAVYGLVVPGTRTYLAVGHSGGHESGVQYKGVDQCGNGCGGPCPKDCRDEYLYYWAYDLRDLLLVKNGQKEPHEMRPYAYGKFPSPYGSSKLGGGTYDPASGTMYLEHLYADTDGYNALPAIAAYKFATGGENGGAAPTPAPTSTPNAGTPKQNGGKAIALVSRAAERRARMSSSSVTLLDGGGMTTSEYVFKGTRFHSDLGGQFALGSIKASAGKLEWTVAGSDGKIVRRKAGARADLPVTACDFDGAGQDASWIDRRANLRFVGLAGRSQGRVSLKALLEGFQALEVLCGDVNGDDKDEIIINLSAAKARLHGKRKLFKKRRARASRTGTILRVYDIQGAKLLHEISMPPNARPFVSAENDGDRVGWLLQRDGGVEISILSQSGVTSSMRSDVAAIDRFVAGNFAFQKESEGAVIVAAAADSLIVIGIDDESRTTLLDAQEMAGRELLQ